MAGCVRTVDDRKAAAFPGGKDKAEARYERPPQQVYDEAIYVLSSKGTIQSESVIREEQEEATVVIQTIRGHVGKSRVWIRVQPIDSSVTAVTVQVRTKGGGTDRDLTYELDKLIALQLVE